MHTNNNLPSINCEVTLLCQLIDVASQFAVAGNMLKCFAAAKFPPTIFSFIHVCTFHSRENLVEISQLRNI